MSTVALTEFDLDGKTFPCRIRRSTKAKYIALRITPDGKLELVLPAAAKVEDGISILEKNKAWIRKRKKLLRDGDGGYYYMGERIQVAREYSTEVGEHHLRLKAGMLSITSPDGSTMKTTTIYNGFIRQQAKRYLIPRAEELAVKYNFSVTRYSLRQQKSRWGSCSSKGTISLNINLMKCPSEVIDYVIVHEFCHLRYMDHSQKFWREVEKYIPEYKKLRKQLKFYSRVN